MACGFDWELDGVELARSIGKFGVVYRARFERLRRADDDALRARPDPDVWSPLEYLSHMADVTAFYLDRIQRVLDEDRPMLSAVGFSDLPEARRYNDNDVEGTLARLDELATSTATRLRSLEPSQWRRIGIGSDGAERDVLVLARRLAHEGHHHLLDISH